MLPPIHEFSKLFPVYTPENCPFVEKASDEEEEEEEPESDICSEDEEEIIPDIPISLLTEEFANVNRRACGTLSYANEKRREQIRDVLRGIENSFKTASGTAASESPVKSNATISNMVEVPGTSSTSDNIPRAGEGGEEFASEITRQLNTLSQQVKDTLDGADRTSRNAVHLALWDMVDRLQHVEWDVKAAALEKCSRTNLRAIAGLKADLRRPDNLEENDKAWLELKNDMVQDIVNNPEHSDRSSKRIGDRGRRYKAEQLRKAYMNDKRESENKEILKNMSKCELWSKFGDSKPEVTVTMSDLNQFCSWFGPSNGNVLTMENVTFKNPEFSAMPENQVSIDRQLERQIAYHNYWKSR